jgi:hypothetical protein
MIKLQQTRDSLWRIGVAFAHLWFYSGGRSYFEMFVYRATFGSDNQDLIGKRIKITIEIVDES